MSKISELSDGGALQSTDYLIAVRSGGNVKVQPAGMTFSSVTITSSDINGGNIDGTIIGAATPAAGSFTTGQFGTSLNVDGTVTADGLTVDGNVVFNTDQVNISDNIPKLVFTDTDTATIASITGNSSNLVYDTASSARDHTFSQAGSVRLEINSTGIDVTGVAVVDGLTSSAAITSTSNSNSLGGTTFTSAISGTTASMSGSVTISGNSNTIGGTTFSSGIDVTGTVTADGLTVDGSSSGRVVLGTFSNTTNAAGTEAAIELRNSATNLCDVSLVASRVAANFGSDFYIETSDGVDGTNRKRLNIGENGDVSLYEETGTTPKFFWDASAEALGLGTTSPDYGIDLRAAVSNGLRVGSSGNTFGSLLSWDNASGLARLESLGAYPLVLGTNSTERLRITSAGSVGIGTSSPDAIIETSASATGNTVGALLTNTNGSGTADSVSLSFGLGRSADSFIRSVNAIKLLKEQQWTGTPSTADAALVFSTVSDEVEAERMRITSAGDVGIGTTSPDTLMELRAANPVLTIRDTETSTASNDARLRLAETGVSDALGNYYDIGYINGALQFRYNTSEYMRLDDSGNLLVGTTDTTLYNNTSGGGVMLSNSGSGFAKETSGTGDPVVYFNNTGDDGQILDLRKDGTTVGSIGVASGDIAIYSTTAGHHGLRFGNGQILPTNNSGTIVDNAVDLGDISFRFQDIYATNGTIQTSDANEKQDIEELSEAEHRVAVAAKGLLRKFRWINSVEEKGGDARIHFGIIAQDLQAAFEAEGLDAGRYAMFIHSTWTDEETGEERSRMGVRYSELFAFIIAAL